MLVNLTPHPIRVFSRDTPDVVGDEAEPAYVLPPATAGTPPARVGEIYLGDQSLPGVPVPVAYVEYRAATGLPSYSEPHAQVYERTWYVVSLALALHLAGRRCDLLVPFDEVRNETGTVVGCRALALPV